MPKLRSQVSKVNLDELFPKPMGRPIPLNEICTDAISSKSQQINPEVSARKPHVTIQRLSYLKETILTGKGRREPTKSELMQIGSYPMLYNFAGNGRQYWERIGNSVPPLMMYAIAARIRNKLWNGQEPQKMSNKMDYPAHLAAMWQKHLEPRADDAPTVISTFAGCGGSSLGYSMAGYLELLAVEWDDNAVETFKLNFPGVPVYHGDIAKLSVNECLELAGIEPGELDLFDGSPPCQGFSTAGKRQIDDPRNDLFKEYVRLLRGLKPKVFVMENVSGLVKGKMKLVFAEIMKELKSSGYRVSCRLLNAMYFHVPQSRQRLIFIGVRDDLGIEPSHPKGESKKIVVKDALKNASSFLPHVPDYNTKLGQCCRKLKQGQNGEALFGENWGFQLIRLKENDIAPTVSKGTGITGFIHPVRPEKISMGELKRIASFPDNYQFIGKRNLVQDRIGNSVPPLMMEAIARHIRKQILQPALIGGN
jgi:DNA (cytosine-5)-methyltransferase 1